MGMFQPDNGSFRHRAPHGQALARHLRGQPQDPSGKSSGSCGTCRRRARGSVSAGAPEIGEFAILKWGTEQVMCRVVWTEGDMCGLSFENPIASAVVSETARLLGIVEHPTAAISNIPVGRPGARRRASAAAQAEQEPAGQPARLARYARGCHGTLRAAAAAHRRGADVPLRLAARARAGLRGAYRDARRLLT